VGFTRARKTLYISHAMRRLRYDGFQNNPPSRFLKDIPILHSERVNMFGKSQQRVASSHRHPVSSYVNTERLPHTLPKPLANKWNQTAISDHPNYGVGDIVVQPIHGIGKVVEMKASGPDYEVTVFLYTAKRNRKYISKFSNLEKYDEGKHEAQYGPVHKLPMQESDE